MQLPGMITFVALKTDMTNEHAIFSRNWPIYQQLVNNNYMLHREIGQLTGDWMKRVSSSEGSHILDLGCGDCSEMANILGHLDYSSYTGIDLSEMALKVAQKNLEELPSVRLLTGPMESVIETLGENFAIIHSCYAIHHLQDNAKQELFRAIHKKLAHGGVFILGDIFRNPGQNREHYLKRYTEMIRKDWGVIKHEDQDLILEHIHSSDFPASIDDCKSWLSACGFFVEEGFEANEQHKLLILRKHH
ncbi:MAG: class I SAM-dependent methyltransferase [Bacteroidota bacterium]